jgi:hypothetical protein
MMVLLNKNFWDVTELYPRTKCESIQRDHQDRQDNLQAMRYPDLQAQTKKKQLEQDSLDVQG